MYSYKLTYSAALAYFVAGEVLTVNQVAVELFIVITSKMLMILCKSLKKEEKLGGIDWAISRTGRSGAMKGGRNRLS